MRERSPTVVLLLLFLVLLLLGSIHFTVGGVPSNELLYQIRTSFSSPLRSFGVHGGLLKNVVINTVAKARTGSLICLLKHAACALIRLKLKTDLPISGPKSMLLTTTALLLMSHRRIPVK
ncbi:hypothetical protein EVAR_94352_1 [Eumeta japonica]|uniref:Uncharacterized protein n=1 Tax=Eumeta variegata TaxID=151549 RepID=A0A4C1TPV5_EUMVA|nr:hypothetical protein EVAR_94352_1 [Eumeta japonica]